MWAYSLNVDRVDEAQMRLKREKGGINDGYSNEVDRVDQVQMRLKHDAMSGRGYGMQGG